MSTVRTEPETSESAYLDFEIEIGPGQGREYPVTVLRAPSGEARGVLLFPYDELTLESRLKDLQIALLMTAETRRRLPTLEEQPVQRFGQDLFDALLAGEIRSAYDISWRQAEAQGKGLRVKLRVQSPALASLPWEFLYDPREGEYLCLMSDRPVVRYVEAVQPVQPLRITPPLRILGMIASPTGMTPLNVEQEKLRLAKATEKLQAQGLVELTWLEGQTWRELQRAMRSGPWHIFHFVGHGGFDPVRDEGLIIVADDAGQPQYLTATDLSRLLADHKPLRLVLLNACEGARGGNQDIFSSTASILVRRGIPAVVAMQYPITDRAAVEFARSFYESLADGLPADAAVSEARKAVSIAVDDTAEWGTPVLYMRASDGRIFDITPVPRPAEPRPAPPSPQAEQPAPQEVAPAPPTSAPKSTEWVTTAPLPYTSAADDRTRDTARPQPAPQVAAPAPAAARTAAGTITPPQEPAPSKPASRPRWVWPTLGGAIALVAIVVALMVTRGGGGDRVTPIAPEPRIGYFRAVPQEISQGECSTLEWGSLSNTNLVSIDQGIGSVATSGKREVCPSDTTTYLMKASGSGGTASASVKVAVYPRPSISYFRATPATIATGACTTLEWATARNAAEASIDQGVGDVATPGSISLCPTATTTYVMTLIGRGGKITLSTTVTVTQPMISIPGRLTLVTGDNGTVNNPILELSGTFSGSPYRIVLDQPNDLQPRQSDVYDFSVPAAFCEITSFSVSKPASPGGEDDWYLKGVDLSLDDVEVYFDAVADRLITSDSYGYSGGWAGTQYYKTKCGV